MAKPNTQEPLKVVYIKKSTSEAMKNNSKEMAEMIDDELFKSFNKIITGS